MLATGPKLGAVLCILLQEVISPRLVTRSESRMLVNWPEFFVMLQPLEFLDVSPTGQVAHFQETRSPTVRKISSRSGAYGA